MDDMTFCLYFYFSFLHFTFIPVKRDDDSTNFPKHGRQAVGDRSHSHLLLNGLGELTWPHIQ